MYFKTKRTLYPKTERLTTNIPKITITEKLDGSNLGLFKLDGKLVVAQRNYLFTYPNPDIDYKGLQWWLAEHADDLLENLHEGAGVFGEWIGMGRIKYGETLDKRFYIFAKVNIEEDFKLKNLYYDPTLFIYPFKDQEIPEYIGVVPLVAKAVEYPTKDYLDALYDEYVEEVNRPVEGFVINNNNSIKKYVRYKNGHLEDHKG